MKPGYKTSEFWLTVLTTAWQLLNLSGVWDFVPNAVSLGAATVSVASYAISRGLAKRPALAAVKAPATPTLAP